MKYLVALLLAVGINPAAHSACQIGGSYAFSATGWGSNDGKNPDLKLAIAGVWTFSPSTSHPLQGTVRRFFTLSGDGSAQTVTEGSPGTSGTYTIDASTCAGTVQFPDTPVAGGIERYSIVATRTGSAIYWINMAQAVVLSARMERQ